MLIRLLRRIATRLASLKVAKHASEVRAQQIRTLANVITSVGVFVIVLPNKQCAISRELRCRIKETLEKNNFKPLDRAAST